MLFDIFHIAALIGASGRNRFFAEEARTRRVPWLEDVAKAGLGILGRHAKQSLHSTVIHAAAFANQIVILVQDVNRTVYVRRFTLDGQSIVMEEGRNMEGRLEEFQILIQSAK
jgi:hypothetical protein